MSSTQREYDPEIKDIADYVANKTIDSELAVSIVQFQFQSSAAEASILHPAIYPASKLHPLQHQRNYHEKFNWRSIAMIHC